MSIPVTPRRTEPLLLPKLRTLFPDVTFDTIERADLEPPFTEATLADSMQGMSTPISQYVRLRLSVRCMREDHMGDWDKAARLWAAIAKGDHRARNRRAAHRRVTGIRAGTHDRRGQETGERVRRAPARGIRRLN